MGMQGTTWQGQDSKSSGCASGWKTDLDLGRVLVHSLGLQLYHGPEPVLVALTAPGRSAPLLTLGQGLSAG